MGGGVTGGGTDNMGLRAHGGCIDGAEYGALMRQTQEQVRRVLATARERQAVSQQRLARVIGVKREAMRDRLSGRTQLKAEELAALAAFLEIDVSEFFPEFSPDDSVGRESSVDLSSDRQSASAGSRME